MCTDAGYGTLENYTLLEKPHIGSYLKYRGWDRDAKGTRRPYEAESFTYDEKNDQWICPQGKPLRFERLRKQTNARTGYKYTYREYRAKESDCAACPVKEECTRGKLRSLRISPEIRKHRETAIKNLTSMMGVQMRSLRSVEAETPFGVSKNAYRFARYHLRGKAGAEIETGLFLSAIKSPPSARRVPTLRQDWSLPHVADHRTIEPRTRPRGSAATARLSATPLHKHSQLKLFLHSHRYPPLRVSLQYPDR